MRQITTYLEGQTRRAGLYGREEATFLNVSDALRIILQYDVSLKQGPQVGGKTVLPATLIPKVFF